MSAYGNAFKLTDSEAAPSHVEGATSTAGWAGRYQGALLGPTDKRRHNKNFEAEQVALASSTRRPRPSPAELDKFITAMSTPLRPPAAPALFRIPVETNEGEACAEDAFLNVLDEEALKQEESKPVQERGFKLWLAAVLPFDDVARWEKFREFVLEWGLAVLHQLQKEARMNGSHMYRIEDNCIVPAFAWSSALRQFPFRWREVRGVRCQFFLAPYFICAELNPGFRTTLTIIKAGDEIDIKRFRASLILGPPTELAKVDGNYIIRTGDWEVDEKIRLFHETGDWRVLEADPEALRGYVGTSQDMEVRAGTASGHRSNAEAVNSRMQEERDLCGGKQRDWDANAVTITSRQGKTDAMPFQARHCVEHGIITLFGFTEADNGGRNVNLVDQPGWETLVPAPVLISIIRGLEAVVTMFPQYLLPIDSDVWVWETLLKPFLPDGTPASLNTILQACYGNSRPYTWHAVEHPNLSTYLDKRRYVYSFEERARSAEFVAAKGFPEPSYYTNKVKPAEVLGMMAEVMASSAAAQDFTE